MQVPFLVPLDSFSVITLDYVLRTKKETYQDIDLPFYYYNVESNDIKLQYRGIIGIRYIIKRQQSGNATSIVQDVLASRTLLPINGIIRRNEDAELVNEATRLIARMCQATDQMQTLVSQLDIQTIVNLICNKHEEISDNAVQIMTVICNTLNQYCVLIARTGVIDRVVTHISSQETRKQHYKNYILFLESFLENDNYPPYEDMKNAIPILIQKLSLYKTLRLLYPKIIIYVSYAKDNTNRFDHMNIIQNLIATLNTEVILGKYTSYGYHQEDPYLRNLVCNQICQLVPDLLSIIKAQKFTNQSIDASKLLCKIAKLSQAYIRDYPQMVQWTHIEIQNVIQTFQEHNPMSIKLLSNLIALLRISISNTNKSFLYTFLNMNGLTTIFNLIKVIPDQKLLSKSLKLFNHIAGIKYGIRKNQETRILVNYLNELPVAPNDTLHKDLLRHQLQYDLTLMCCQLIKENDNKNLTLFKLALMIISQLCQGAIAIQQIIIDQEIISNIFNFIDNVEIQYLHYAYKIIIYIIQESQELQQHCFTGIFSSINYINKRWPTFGDNLEELEFHESLFKIINLQLANYSNADQVTAIVRTEKIISNLSVFVYRSRVYILTFIEILLNKANDEDLIFIVENNLLQYLVKELHMKSLEITLQIVNIIWAIIQRGYSIYQADNEFLIKLRNYAAYTSLSQLKQDECNNKEMYQFIQKISKLNPQREFS